MSNNECFSINNNTNDVSMLVSKRRAESENNKKVKLHIETLEKKLSFHKQLASYSASCLAACFDLKDDFSALLHKTHIYKSNLKELLPKQWLGEKLLDGFLSVFNTVYPQNEYVVFSFSYRRRDAYASVTSTIMFVTLSFFADSRQQLLRIVVCAELHACQILRQFSVALVIVQFRTTNCRQRNETQQSQHRRQFRN